MAFGLPFFLFLQLLLHPLFSKAQTQSNITLGSSLTALNDNSSWQSPSGDFAVGFRRIRTGDFLLAIWFNKIPDKTIIWSANGNTLAPTGSKIQLTTDGRLVLNDPKGQQIWAANSPGTGVAYAALLDSGNFVLASRDSINLWQSFDQPTDTIMPGQLLNHGSRLLARFSETNYAYGRFQLLFQADGNLLLYTTAFPLTSVNSAYWSTETGGTGFELIFNRSGNIYLTAGNGETLAPILSSTVSTDEFYLRAIVEYNGVLRLYVHPKAVSSSSAKWSSASFVPADICMSILQNTGGGACGFNSYCKMIEDTPTCQCPPGYAFLDPSDELGGCKPMFKPPTCSGGSKETGLFEIVEMIDTDWPLSDYEYFHPVTEEWCREACLGDCLCAVAIFRDGNCWKKKIPLSNGRVNPSVGGKALIKVGKYNSTSQKSTGSVWGKEDSLRA